jgi:hypothetical protein
VAQPIFFILNVHDTRAKVLIHRAQTHLLRPVGQEPDSRKDLIVAPSIPLQIVECKRSAPTRRMALAAVR